MQNLARTILFSLFCALLFWTVNTVAAVVSNFDTDGDAWHVLTYTNPGAFVSDDGLAAFDNLFGNPPGSISATDPGDNFAARWGAPDKFLGDKSAFIGGQLRFDIIVKANPGPTSLPVVPGLVLIENASANLALAYTGALPNAASWTSYTVPLGANALAPGFPPPLGFWASFAPNNPSLNPASAADFVMVFANITRLSITGEVTDGTDDTLALDNVNLVPIPAALPLLGSALFGLGFTARRRRG